MSYRSARQNFRFVRSPATAAQSSMPPSTTLQACFRCLKRFPERHNICPNRKFHSTSEDRTATAAASTQASNLPPDFKNAIQREAVLPTPDPPPDSQTAHLTSSHLPYMVPTYVRPPPIFTKGRGCTLYDIENRAYLDFTAGIAVTALGHCDPTIQQIISSQAATLMHTSNLYHNPWIGLLSQTLVEATKKTGGMRDAARAFICNSGTEANEAAIKFARKSGRHLDSSGRKHKILSFHNCFHGRTMGALSATPNPKYQDPFSPMLPGFEYADFNDAAATESLITDETCGILVEPIQGEGGVNVAAPAFLRALRRRCDETGALLIYDEIQCGLGRTGNFWAHSAEPDIPHPDVLTTAKALGNGFPVAAVLTTGKVSDRIVTGDHGTTFGGNPLGARVAQHIVGRLSEPGFLADVQRKGDVFTREIKKIRQRFPEEVAEIRGRGLILGVQLKKDPTPIVTAARERGLLVITCGSQTLRLVPPLVVEESEILEGMRILEEAMAVVFGSREKVEGTVGQQEMGSR